jgi:hypothetical protein
MHIVSGIMWIIVAIFAGLMGVLLISDEPGATAARWYFVFAALAAPVAVACFVWARGRASMVLALASIALVALIALHAFVIVAFAYQGLTVLLLIPAILAAAFATAAWARRRGEPPRSPAG